MTDRPHYLEILVRRYNLRGSIRLVEDSYSTIKLEGDARVPPKDELDALWPGVKAEMEAETEEARKEEAFLRNYSLTRVMEIVVSGDRAAMSEMLETWSRS